MSSGWPAWPVPSPSDKPRLGEAVDQEVTTDLSEDDLKALPAAEDKP